MLRDEEADEMGERARLPHVNVGGARERERGTFSVCVFEACARTWRAERTVVFVFCCAAVGAAVGPGPRAIVCSVRRICDSESNRSLYLALAMRKFREERWRNGHLP